MGIIGRNLPVITIAGAVVCLSLCGCGKKEASENKTPKLQIGRSYTKKALIPRKLRKRSFCRKK
ncbi:MAG: hypothetical protein HND38_16525 [Planctomycetes bacterium]|nr:hypothetical protein [Planctomycetota bacterium]